jgi:hypothetical protein
LSGNALEMHKTLIQFYQFELKYFLEKYSYNQQKKMIIKKYFQDFILNASWQSEIESEEIEE